MAQPRKQFSPSDFKFNNFIEEIEPVRSISKSGLPRLVRQVKMKCIKCNTIFTASLHNALKCGGYCSRQCSNDRNTKVQGTIQKHPLYHKWMNMRQRCENPNNTSYHHYGGRGITVSDDLKEFKDYIDYVMSLPNAPTQFPTKLEIDRINNDLGYTKGNLRWTTRSVNMINTRNKNTKKVGSIPNVFFRSKDSKWEVRLRHEGKEYYKGTFNSEADALIVRNQLIIDNNLPHKLI